MLARAFARGPSSAAHASDHPALARPQSELGAAPLGDAASARRFSDAPSVEVELSGELDGLRPMVQAALYRLAQESITNAIRHARNASRVLVRVVADGDVVRLTVSDDGDPPRTAARGAGFGIAGMAERAALLGGSLSAVGAAVTTLAVGDAVFGVTFQDDLGAFAERVCVAARARSQASGARLA